MKTNKDLVVHCKKALSEKWGYVWGTFGQVLTPSILEQKLKQYPDGVANYESFIRSNWLGRKTSDCVGLIKGCYWGVDDVFSYNSATDVTANTMFYKATEKGTMATIPDQIGVCVWKDGHIGVYIGNGQVIEAHGTKYGVIQTPLKGGTPWTHWLKCPYIQYEVPVVSTPVTANPFVGTVIADVLNVRDGAGTQFNVIGKLNKGDTVKIANTNGDWYSIYFGNHGGYVSKQYIK